jgi:hypothetical protein
MRLPLRRLASLCLVAAGCQKEAPRKPIQLDTAASEAEDVTCVPARFETNGQAFVVVRLDSAAAAANRLLINIVKQDSTLPIHARLQASTGAAECDGMKSAVEFTVRGAQSYLGLVVRAGTTFLAVNAKRVHPDQMINGRAFTTDDTNEELVWGAATPGALDNQPGQRQSTPAPPPYREPPPRRVPRP